MATTMFKKLYAAKSKRPAQVVASLADGETLAVGTAGGLARPTIHEALTAAARKITLI